MIGDMIPFAFAAGLAVGWLSLARRRIDYILLVIYFADIRTRSEFEAIYEMADDEAMFMRYKVSDPTVETLADYLQLHSSVRESAYNRYKRLYGQLLRSVLLYTPPAIILIALVFTKWWYYFLLGVGVMFVALFIHKIVVTNHRVGYYQRMMVAAILKAHQKDQKNAIQQSHPASEGGSVHS